MRRVEYPHHTAEQVRGYVDEALRIVAEQDPPEDLRTAVFSKAADLLAAKQIVMEQIAPMGVARPGGR